MGPEAKLTEGDGADVIRELLEISGLEFVNGAGSRDTQFHGTCRARHDEQASDGADAQH
jgi:hypothetical protein